MEYVPFDPTVEPKQELMPATVQHTRHGIEPMAVVNCGGGLAYAEMKKEEAREDFKERKRQELLRKGQIDRTKRRKKNDTSMSENDKYRRRLQMNQDSAAAARYAQEVYVNTLEKLVSTTEAEKSSLDLEASQLRSENASLASRLRALQEQLDTPSSTIATTCLGSAPVAVAPIPMPVHPTSQQAHMGNGNIDGQHHPNAMLSSPNANRGTIEGQMLYRKLMNIFESPEQVSALANDADFAAGNMGIRPARAV